MKPKQTPSQTAGPFFHYMLTPEQSGYDKKSLAGPALGDASTAGERIRVTVDADDSQRGVSLEKCLGVTGHAQGCVDENRALVLERGSEELESALEQHGSVDGVVCHGDMGRSRELIPIRYDLTSGKKVRACRLGVSSRDQKSPGITSSVVFTKSASALS